MRVTGSQWGSLSIILTKAALSMVAVFTVAYFEKFVFAMSAIPTFVSILLAMWYSITQAEKAHSVLYEIKST